MRQASGEIARGYDPRLSTAGNRIARRLAMLLDQSHLLSLPAHPYDTARVVYRVVDVEGFICYERNLYSVPWRLVGQMLAESEKTSCSHLEFLRRVLSPVVAERRQRSIERRIHQARFRDEAAALETFNWKFNPSIDRVQIEELATADFVRRGDNLILAGQSGLGKSHVIQSIGRRACVDGYRVCYITSADLLRKLAASLAVALPCLMLSRKTVRLLDSDTILGEACRRWRATKTALDAGPYSCPRYSPAAVANASSGEP